MKIILENISPEECELSVAVFNNENVEVTSESFSLSSLPNDVYNFELQGINDFIRRYLQGDKSYSSLISTGEFDSAKISFIQRVDLAYRLEDEILKELLVTDNIDKLIKYRRAFVIAWKVNNQDIIDLFIERQPLKWFTPILEVSADLANYFSFEAEKQISISQDKSAKQIGSHFYIHSGTNDWNKAWLYSNFWDDRWDKQLNIWQNQLKKTEVNFLPLNLVDYTFLIVPEKDAISRVVNRDYVNSNNLPFIFLQRLSDKLVHNKVFYPLIELVNSKDDTRFELPDSHLSASDYWLIFLNILEKWGFTSEAKELVCEFDFVANYGDLGSKFEKYDGKRQVLNITKPKLGEAKVIEGAEEFRNPLRDCFVKWQNKKPLIKKSVLLLGDSHCSIGASPFLSYLFSKVFSEVTFYWNPFYLTPLEHPRSAKYDFALSEMSQRFINPALK